MCGQPEAVVRTEASLVSPWAQAAFGDSEGVEGVLWGCSQLSKSGQSPGLSHLRSWFDPYRAWTREGQKLVCEHTAGWLHTCCTDALFALFCSS